MVIWIDANIILDVLQKRMPYFNDSALIWKLCETNQVTGYFSALTAANLIYIMRKELTPEKIEKILSSLMLIFRSADLTPEDLNKAASMHWKDFEDAVQVCSAARFNANFIITRNPNDFSESPIPALQPNEFLSKFKNVRE